MTGAAHLLGPGIRGILKVLCKIDAEELRSVPWRGPLIVVTNHINFLEAPLLYAMLYPRDIAGFAKTETWKVPFIGMLARVWECVPVNRDANDMNSMRLALEALGKGKLLNVMPEGTRSHDGRLAQGHAGVVAMALRSGVPILPVAHYGGEDFWSNLKRGRRTEVHVRVGQAYRLREPEPGRSKTDRAQAADEIMLSIAALLPPKYRGFYAGREISAQQLIPVKAPA
jgi:1-acyl-sn-glycerol-3-phosphate acyltransferase